MRSRTTVALTGALSCLLIAHVIARPAPPPGFPSGETILGQSAIEPAYDDATGNLMYLLTPLHAPFFAKANSHAVSPLYLIVYPNSAADDVGPMNCSYTPADNCPDHGTEIANAALGTEPTAYASGVWGHDHIGDAPGGADFNVAWQVKIIAFKNEADAHTHVTTEDQLDALIGADKVDVIPTPVIFNCNVVPARTYWLGTPVPAVPTSTTQPLLAPRH
jgi:hypothetical protein